MPSHDHIMTTSRFPAEIGDVGGGIRDSQFFIFVGAGGEVNTNFFHDCLPRKMMFPDLAEPQATHTQHGMRAVNGIKIIDLCTQLCIEIASSVQ